MDFDFDFLYHKVRDRDKINKIWNFLFCILSPTRIDLTLRISCPTKNGNNAFPAVDGGFESFLQNKHTNKDLSIIMDDQIDISEYNLNKLLSMNPVAAASVFKITLETIFEVLFGIVPDYLSKITIPISSRCHGIFGQTKAAYTVTEVQGRLSLHGHMTVWSVLSPTIIQQCIQCKRLVNSVKEVILSQISSSIPLEYHMKALNRQATPPAHRSPSDPPRFFYDSPLPITSINEFNDHVYSVVNSTAVHQRSDTCIKDPLGHVGCRLSYPSNCTAGKSIEINELKIVNANNKKVDNNKVIRQNVIEKNNNNSDELMYEIIPEKNIKFNNIESNFIMHYKPLGLLDNRCIVLEIQKETFYEEKQKIYEDICQKNK